MKDQSLLKNHRTILLVLAVFLNASAVLWFSVTWHLHKSRLYHERHELAHSLGTLLQVKLEASTTMLHELAPRIREADGDIAATQRIINNHVTRAGEGLRIAWSDADRQLRVGTAIGLFGAAERMVTPEAIDLSHRDYIQAAAQNPGEIIIGAIKPHAVTGRDFFAVAIGVANNGAYLGCLASIIDVEYLQRILEGIARQSPVWVTITLANGNRLFEAGTEPEPKSIQTDRFNKLRIESGVEKQELKRVARDTWLQAAGWIAGINILLAFTYWAIYRAYIRPLRELAATFLTLPSHLVPHTAEDGAEITRIIERARHIKDLLMEHHAVQEHSHDQKQSLKEAISTIDSLHAEQLTFLSTVGAEMEETFTAIRRYASFLEGGLEEDYYHTDSLFLESLKDSAQNLKFLSNAFYLMCLQKAGNYQGKTDEVNLKTLCGQVAALFAESMEFRQQPLTLNSDSQPVTRQDEAILRHVLWGVFFLLAKYADDGAELTVDIHRKETGLHFQATASACLPGHIPEVDPDMAPFFPVSLNQARMLEDAISSHVDFAVAHFLLEHFCAGGKPPQLSVKAAKAADNGLSFTLAFDL